MQYVRDEVFHFLEKSPYFYKKEKFLNKQGSENSAIKEMEVDQLNYVFLEHNPRDQVFAEISIPVTNPHEEIKWKYIQLNDKVNKPVYQSANSSDLEIMPLWFKSLILEAKDLYENNVILYKLFAPSNKN